MMTKLGTLLKKWFEMPTAGNRRWLLALPILLMVLLFIIPTFMILPRSVFNPDFTVKSFVRVVEQAVYLRIFWTTIRISVIATAITVLIGYPITWIITRSSSSKRTLLLGAVLIPYIMSVLVRTFSWVAILGENGLINSLLQNLGLTTGSLKLLFTQGAVVTALVHVSVPLFVFSLYSTLSRIDPRTYLVARSLGASQIDAFFRVILPLSYPGLKVGVIIVFLFTMSSFIAPSILGSRYETMIAQLIEGQISQGLDWGFAAALAIILVSTSLIFVFLINLFFQSRTRWQNARYNLSDASVNDCPGESNADPSVLLTTIREPKRFPLVNLLNNPKLLSVSGNLFSILLVLFMLLPLVIIIPLSFSSAPVLVFPPPGYSTKWYEAVLTNPDWLRAGLTSLEIGSLVALATVVISVMITLGLGRKRTTFTSIIETLMTAPFAVPSVVYALGSYLFFARLKLVDTPIIIILAHTVLAIPLALMVVSANYQGIDERLEQAARSLGARPGRVLRNVLLPLMRPGMMVGILFSFLMSFDEAVVAIFLSGIHVKTLPRRLWEGIRFETNPSIAAVSTIILLVEILTMVIVFLVQKRSSKKQGWSGILG